VLASYTSNGTTGGGLEILDGLRDLRSNVQNTIPTFMISGFTGGYPSQIINYPEESTGYVFSSAEGTLTAINYGKETATGAVATFSTSTTSVAASSDGTRFAGALGSSGQLVISGSGGTYPLNLPNVFKVAMNSGNTVILAMVRNPSSNTTGLYRVVKVNATSNPVAPPGAVDCQPLLLPVYCVVPVPGTYDHPSDVYFSADGSTAYVLNCGPECGGQTASVTFLQEGALTINVIPTGNDPTPLSVLPAGKPNPIPIPGGVTSAISDGTSLYLAGQQLLSSGPFSGLFAGNLTTLNLTSYKITGTYSISDGHHSKMLFADDNTLWIGSQQCANGQRAALAAQQLAAGGSTTQAANYNCLTKIALGATLVPTIIPAVTQGTGAVAVPYPNTNQDPYYYGSLTGLCWVQNYHKVFTAYGGQIHAFYTGGAITDVYDPAVGQTPAPGTELNNKDITVQGNVLDVAYIDALTNAAN
jgi:hypothetical protein